mmetsp:Transcript_58259/g.103945  ORF Transcript_58259/g.103945 Transcript_58259/m.103945 type:complete len:277 (-) Transcript_58259:727-1557(-)
MPLPVLSLQLVYFLQPFLLRLLQFLQHSLLGLLTLSLPLLKLQPALLYLLRSPLLEGLLLNPLGPRCVSQPGERLLPTDQRLLTGLRALHQHLVLYLQPRLLPLINNRQGPLQLHFIVGPHTSQSLLCLLLPRLLHLLHLLLMALDGVHGLHELRSLMLLDAGHHLRVLVTPRGLRGPCRVTLRLRSHLLEVLLVPLLTGLFGGNKLGGPLLMGVDDLLLAGRFGLIPRPNVLRLVGLDQPQVLLRPLQPLGIVLEQLRPLLVVRRLVPGQHPLLL